MTLALRAHGENQTLNLPWLEQAPSHWQVQRAKNIFSVVDVRSAEGREELLTVSSNDGVRKRSSKAVTMFMAESYAGHKLCWPGDLVVNSLWAWATGLGVTNYHGIISTAYSVYRPKAEFTGYSEFFHHLLRSVPYNWEFTVRSKGIWISRLQLTDQSFLEMPILVPPPEEQEQIVRFVRHLDSKVNRLIKAKRRLIELLNEQKQAIIHQAVTRGLDPTVPLKPSGLDWLESIPAAWEIRKIKDVAIHNPSKTEIRGLQPETPVTVLPMEAVSEWGMVNTTLEEKLVSVQGGLTYMCNGDVSIAKITPCFENGKGAPLHGLPYGFAFGSTEFHILRPQTGVTTDFLYFVTRMPKFRELGELNMKGSAGQKRVPSDFVKNFEFGLPGPVEQEQIVSHLRQALAGIDKTVDKVRAEIDLIREYRTRLVADVVTGQLDVRQHPWANTEIEDSTEAIPDDAELEDDLEETDDVLEEAGV